MSSSSLGKKCNQCGVETGNITDWIAGRQLGSSAEYKQGVKKKDHDCTTENDDPRIGGYQV